eukprot:CAMPEP_0174258998 /NCGR_PEP_ID=MMETSP0439-20130205/7888_1 /TAXON_ID=0 /ORGANISM="Stereomyxa ramosa, Strain Chinc5" /LENGTH=793 /DNA_ID=CAMNT_0015342709 /DNA_START=252 /DNA_END=2633 /DNA_ORIENTATION=+
MDWGIDLQKVVITGATFSGPLAVCRDEKKLLRLTTEDQSTRPETQIFTSSGVALISFNNDAGHIVGRGWTRDERLICVSDKGHVFLYNVKGHKESEFSLECSDGVLDCYIWDSGLVCLTNSLKLIAVTNLEEPRLRPLADPKLQVAPCCWCVVEPSISLSNQVEVLLSTTTGTVLVVNEDNVKDLLLSSGPFLRMSVCKNGKILACFTTEGFLKIVTLDFTKELSDFETKAVNAPKQLLWCGTDAVLMHWPSVGLLMVGPNNDWIKYTYDNPVHLIAECDGVRIITNTSCEFLQKVPVVMEDIFKIGSTAASAILYDAMEYFENENPKADENIRSIKAELSEAVDACTEAAAYEFAPVMQRKLLKAASFGKCFLDSGYADNFVKICKILRVLNAVRNPKIGIPLTYTQYQQLEVTTLINRLVNRHHHLLAWRICEYLDMKRDSVLVHWACLKVGTASDQEVMQYVIPKLQKVKGISYAEIASTAFKYSRNELATRILDFEPRAADQVPLLIHMKEDEVALEKAIESGDTDLVYLVLLHIRRNAAPTEFFRIIRRNPESVNLLIAYCKEQDVDLLKDLYYQTGQPQETANMAVVEAYQFKDIEKRIRGLKVALNLYKDTKEQLATKATETQIRLLLLQCDLEATLKEGEFLGCSMSDTLYRVIMLGDLRRAQKIKSEFKVPDKRYWWIMIKALAQKLEWDQLEAFAKDKKSPIGYRPFADVCIEQHFPRKAAFYIAKISDPYEQAEMYMAIQMWRDAAEVAFNLKNTEMLMSIRSQCVDRNDELFVTDLIDKIK